MHILLSHPPTPTPWYNSWSWLVLGVRPFGITKINYRTLQDTKVLYLYSLYLYSLRHSYQLAPRFPLT